MVLAHCVCVIPDECKAINYNSNCFGFFPIQRILDLASHRRSWWFWADSVTASEKLAFHAAKAKSWEDFKKGRIDESSIVNMGNDCQTRYFTHSLLNHS